MDMRWARCIRGHKMSRQDFPCPWKYWTRVESWRFHVQRSEFTAHRPALLPLLTFVKGFKGRLYVCWGLTCSLMSIPRILLLCMMSNLAWSSWIADKMVEGLISQCLQNKFNADITAHFSQEITSEIPKLVVSDGRKSTLGAVEGMVNRGIKNCHIHTFLATHAYLRHRHPIIPRALCMVKPWFSI